MIRWFLICCAGLITGSTVAQCCSPGNPVGGLSNLSILSKKNFRFIANYRHGYADTYFEGNQPSDFQLVNHANYNFLGLVSAYGISDKLNVEMELGLFINRTQHYNFATPYSAKGYGIYNGVVSVKYNILKETSKEWEWTTGIGGKFPFTSSLQFSNGVELPLDVQPSTNAFGIVAQSFLYKGYIANGLHFFLLNRYENNFENTKRYRYGEAFISSLFISRKITHALNGILQIRHEFRDNDYRVNNWIESSGGNIMYASPQINLNLNQKWNISALVDVPVYRNYNGIQMANKYGVSFVVTRDFDFNPDNAAD